MKMPKTITLRLSDEAYKQFTAAAEADNRSISNLIETLALRRLQDDMFADSFEMAGISENTELLKKLDEGHRQAKAKKGNFVD
jgi:predicted CopG family antitoxin